MLIKRSTYSIFLMNCKKQNKQLIYTQGKASEAIDFASVFEKGTKLKLICHENKLMNLSFDRSVGSVDMIYARSVGSADMI